MIERLTPRQRSNLDRFNIVLVLMVFSSAIFLIGLSSATGVVSSLFIGFVFSFLLLTNYALIHEASHDGLHSHPRVNWLLGMMTSWLFPMPFTLFQVTHIVHHCCNRTDHEMFDCYYEGGNRLLKYIQWYGLLLGLWWPLIPVGALLVALYPPLFHTAPFRNARSTGVLFDDFGKQEVLKLRIETILGILFWSALIVAMDLKLLHLLIIYLCFGFNWSTRQYVTHAFTQRDVLNGALNLKVSKFFGLLLLNGHWDLVHHRHPKIPWYYLPTAEGKYAVGESYLRQYFRLWKGPVLATTSGPKVLKKKRYDQVINTSHLKV